VGIFYDLRDLVGLEIDPRIPRIIALPRKPGFTKKEGAIILLKFSTSTWSVIVLIVPVVPVINPRRLAILVRIQASGLFFAIGRGPIV